MNHLVKTTFSTVLFFCSLLVNQHSLQAQVTLGHNETLEITTLSSDEITIPDTDQLTIEIRGGSGGDVRRYAPGIFGCDTRVSGGAGATAQVTLKIGTSGDALRPGGILRAYLGQQGGQRNAECLNPGPISGGGGGASAIIYLPPGDDPLGSNWRILAVAGGGGGAARPLPGIRRVGQGGRGTINGGNSGQNSGGSISECPEQSPLVLGYSGLGGGLVCSGTNDEDGNTIAKRIGATDITDPTTFRIEIGTPTAGSSNNSAIAFGGLGFAGGGAAGDGGGGGGGVSGGAADNTWPGGGGGSFATTDYGATNGSTTAGADGGGTGKRGFVRITTQSQCPDGDVLLQTQQDVLDFAANYPNCTDLPGNLTISGNQITDLSPLGNLETIGGTLNINQCIALTKLDGLSNLTSIGGNLFILLNEKLTDISALSKLTTISGTLRIRINAELPNLTGLSNLRTVGINVEVNLNNKLIDITGICPLYNQGTIGGGSSFGSNGTTDNPAIICPCLQDTQVPTAACQNLTIQLDPINGAATITPQQIDNGSTDACGTVSLSLSSSSFGCSDIGVKNVSLTVTDESSNSSTCTATVTVEDKIGPTVTCKDATIQLDVEGQAKLTVSAIHGGSFDVCEIAQRRLSQDFFSCNDVGTRTVTLFVDDTNGNTSSCTATVTVEDKVAPIANCQNVTIQLDENGSANLNPQQLDNGSVDACGGTFRLSQETFGCSDVGANTITLIVDDLNGNASSCSATVQVEDNVAPVANCSGAIINVDAQNVFTGPIVSLQQLTWQSFTAQTSGLLSEIRARLVGPDNPGTTASTLAIKVYQGEGTAGQLLYENSLPLSFGNQALWITLFSEEDIAVEAGEKYTLSLFLSSGLQYNWRIGFNNPYPDGRSSTGFDIDTGFRTFVKTITPIPVALDANGVATITPNQIDNGSSDACEILNLSLNETSFTCSDLGIQMVSLTATDKNGNSSSCSTSVNIVDNTAPSAVCQNLNVALNDNGLGTLSAAEIASASTDACGPLNFTFGDGSTEIALDCDQVNSSNLVIVNVTDPSGNQSSCLASFSAVDNIAPVARCKDATVELNENGIAFYSLDILDDGSSDNCSFSFPSPLFSPTCSNVGTYPTTLTVRDISGNESTCTANLTIVDRIAPVALCQDVSIQLDANGLATTSALAIDNGSSDACGITNLSLNQQTFGCAEVGVQTVTLTVTDINGNASSCTAQVTITDEIAPDVVCTDMSITFNGETAIDIPSTSIFDATSSFDICGPVSFVSQNITEIGCEAVGGFVEIEVIGADPNGNTSSCTALVEVLGMPCGFTETGIGCEAGADATYDPVAETYTLTAEDCTGYPDGEVSFVGTTLCGDGEITVHVDAINPNARAGVVMLESTVPGARLVGIVKDLSPRVRTEYRSSTNGSLSAKNKNRSGVDWLRIVRSGNKFKTYTSTNGSYWKLAHTINFSNFAECIEVGLITYAKDADEQAVAVFSQLEISGENSSYTQSTIPPAAMESHAANLQLSTDVALAVSPNPFQDETRIQFTLSQAQQISLAVYNLQGQLVQSFEDSLLDAGEHVRTWEGTNQAGVKMPDGIYLIQLRVADQVINKRVILQQ